MTALPRAFIFDLDGVLANTAGLHLRAWSEVAADLGLAIIPETARALKGLDRDASLDLILRASGIVLDAAQRQALAARKNERYLGLVRALTPHDALPGAHEVLRACRDSGVRTALASSSRNAPQLVNALGLAPLLNAIADPAAVARGKPAPDLFIEAARLLGIAPQQCTGVEDSVSGLRAIRAARMRSIGIGAPEELAEGLPDCVLPSVSGLQPLLLENSNPIT